MIYQYDHRFANVVVNPDNPKRPAQPEIIGPEDKYNSDYFATPQYWVEEKEVASSLNERGWKSRWILVQKKVTSPTNERTHLATVVPISGTTESLHCILALKITEAPMICCLLANLNSIPFDFVARQKIGGENFNYFVLKQLPVIPPDRYTPELLDFIVPRVVELTYTAWDLLPFAEDVLKEVGEEKWSRWFPDNPPDGEGKPAPFLWDEERRAALRADLDGLYAHLYQLDREDLHQILDTFPIVKRKDEARYGEFRTKRLVLEAFDRLASLG